MPSVLASLSPLQRDVLIGIVAVGLVTGPFWIGVFGFGDEIHTYERAEVATDGENVVYEERSSPFGPVPISDDIACSADWVQIRTCTFEAQIVENEPVLTQIRTENPEHTTLPFEEYEYVRVDDTLYETVYTDGDDEGRVYLDLERVDPEAALEHVSIAAERRTVPEAVREAAETGEVETRTEIDVPQTPIKTDDGRYYRVYRDGSMQPSWVENALVTLVRFGGPIAGLALFYHLSRRVTYVDSVKRDNR